MTNARDRLLAAFYWHSTQLANAKARAKDKRASRHTQASAEVEAKLHEHHAATLSHVLQNWTSK